MAHVCTSTIGLTALIDSLMADALNDALGISLRREPRDLTSLARKVCEAVRPLAGAKGQTRIGEETTEPILCGDAECLRDALDDLASNGIEYNPTGGAITARVGRQAGSQGPELVCAVADHGYGLSLEDASRVFSRFPRLLAKPTGDVARSRTWPFPRPRTRYRSRRRSPDV